MWRLLVPVRRAPRLASCSICGAAARGPVGSAPPDSKRPAAQGPRDGLDHDDGAAPAVATAGSKRRRTDAPAPPAMAMALVAKVAPAAAAAEGQLQQPPPGRGASGCCDALAAGALLTAHEPDLKDLLLDLSKPWHVAAHKGELPQHPEGPLETTFPVTVPKGTPKIAKEAFYRCSSLTEITLPPTLTEIGEYTLMGCSSLAKITLPPGLTAIGGSAFYGCTSLAEITLLSALTTIEGYAFFGCTSLAEITLPPRLLPSEPRRSRAAPGRRVDMNRLPRRRDRSSGPDPWRSTPTSPSL